MQDTHETCVSTLQDATPGVMNQSLSRDNDYTYASDSVSLSTQSGLSEFYYLILLLHNDCKNHIIQE